MRQPYMIMLLKGDEVILTAERLQLQLPHIGTAGDYVGTRGHPHTDTTAARLQTRQKGYDLYGG